MLRLHVEPWTANDRSETDAESLTSYTTLQSHASSSSYLPRPQHINPSTSASPSPRLASFSSQSGASHAHLRPSYRTSSSADAQGVPSFASRTGSPSSPLGPGSLRERALSSSSSQYRPFAPPLPLGDGTSALGLTVPLAEHGRRSSATSADEREKRRKRREERRAEKAERSTLKGEGYDSPLRRFIRGLSVREKSRWGLPIGLAAAGGVKVLVAAVVCYVGELRVGCPGAYLISRRRRAQLGDPRQARAGGDVLVVGCHCLECFRGTPYRPQLAYSSESSTLGPANTRPDGSSPVYSLCCSIRRSSCSRLLRPGKLILAARLGMIG